MRSIVLASLLVVTAAAAAYAQIHASASQREFEVASVKPLGPKEQLSLPQIDRQRFVYRSTVFNFVFQAFHPQCAADCAFAGAPAWLDQDKFSIEATLPGDIPAYSRVQFMHGKAPEISQMLQALLEDRFKLKIHWEARELPVYEITVDKTGPKLKAATQPSAQGPAGTSFGGFSGTVTTPLPNGQRRTSMTLKDSSVEEFANTLADIMDRPVLDRSDIKGEFDFALQYESDPDAPSNGGGRAGFGALPGPAMFKAMQEQLGLTMKATKSQIEVLVIDHVEKPSEN